MRRPAFCLLALMAFQAFCHGDVTKLPADDQKVLRDITHFHQIHAATNLPAAIFALCADSRGKLAEPGKKWQATDVHTDDTLPDKRLVWAVTDGNYYVVHYESGGIGHSYHIVVAKLKNGESKPNFVWYGIGQDRLKDYKAFIDALADNKLDDRSRYSR